MTKSTITRERVVALIAEHSYDSALVDALEHLLAAMDSELVAEVVSIYGDPEAFGEREIRPLVGIQQMPYGTKLYRHAQPAPVVQMVPEEPPEHLLPNGNSRDTTYRRGAIILAWKLCRSAMLAAAPQEVK
ncbi:hypothetical protein A6P56_07245 [Klebsiella pneumoniae]|uniref:hypothetical protein n=1 Tax=Klebsiella pneumoniae TaxID=573 RepID=UPI0009584475|nr:hypothetical protein [Klebsiella pneumoniae]APV24067.1 hypothetical protein A6P56_07245 [Klebsiella pneumoniae]HBV4477920.1 hypothetical protein [Klebsiella pneumoniae]